MSFWKSDPSLSYAFARLQMIYSEGDALYLSRDKRFDFLLLAVADLQRQHRKERPELYQIAVAQVFAWFASLAETYFPKHSGDNIAIGMAHKYPEEYCGYCGKNPCACDQKNRSEHSHKQYSGAQVEWSINRWQTHLQTLYGEANARGGAPRALNRLFEEVAEVGQLMHLADGFEDSREELQNKVAREMSDVLAWLFATASILNVSVEVAVSTLYNNLCPVCRHPVCACRSFERRPKLGTLAHRFMPAEEIAAALAAA
jgi:NTP pyrophosphatase (non-canonical NTP hydrolase)